MRRADFESSKTKAIQEASRAEILISEKSPSSIRKGGGKSREKGNTSRGDADMVSERKEVAEPPSGREGAQKTGPSRPETIQIDPAPSVDPTCRS